jgi:hypothetical protein
MPTSADGPSGAALEVVQLMMDIADGLDRLGRLAQQPGVPPYLQMGPRVEQWADFLRTTADQAARFTRSAEIQQIVDGHVTRRG